MLSKELEQLLNAYEVRVHYHEDVVLHKIKQDGVYPEEITFEEFIEKIKACIHE